MTMLDDDRLASLFARAGASFDVPATGPDDIVARAAGRVATAADGDGKWTATSIAPTRVTATTRGRRRSVATAPQGRVRRLAGVAGRHRVLVGRRLHRGPGGAGRRGRRAGAQPGAPDHHGRAAPHLGQGSGRCAEHDDDHPRATSSSGSRRKPRTPPPPVSRTATGSALGEHGHAAEHAEPAQRRRGPIRQDRADRFPDADRRPREPEPDGHAVGRARRLRRRLRGQLADAVRCNPLRQRDAPGAGEQLRRGARARHRRSAGRRTSRPRPPTSPGSTSICSRASPPCRPAASNT